MEKKSYSNYWTVGITSEIVVNENEKLLLNENAEEKQNLMIKI